ncbi:MAG: GNAT family N-acetyltransferase [Campylobacteraceae bacterium]|nr:GNAT family N-acetyltransferase [Campylobacteraceae bacterium]
MTIDDYEHILELFNQTPGITIREADSRKSIENYLLRNPKLNFVALVDEKIIACVMCGHDGRRGYLQHLVVHPQFRKQGIGEKLFAQCINNLKKIGIEKTHIFVFKNNDHANLFWKNKKWQLRADLNMYSYNSSSNKNI